MQKEQIDPARLDGEALRRWYTRTPAETEAARQAESARRYEAYFRPASGQPPGAGAQPTKTLASTGPSYGRLQAPSQADAEFRRRQGEFADVRREAAKDNRWTAAPALAPVILALGLGSAALAGLVSRPHQGRLRCRPLCFVGANLASEATGLHSQRGKKAR